MAFSHPTSNNMLCDYTFMCPRILFSSPMGSWLKCPPCQDTTILSLFQLPEVYKQGKFSQIIQSHLCCCLDNTSPRPASTSTSAAASEYSMPIPQVLVPGHLACVHQEDRRLSLASQLTSQEHAHKCTIDFHLQVNSPLKNVLASAPLTFTCKSPHCYFIPFVKTRHCGTVRFLWRSHPALVSLILLPGATSPARHDTHCGLGFAFFVEQYLLRYCHKVPHLLLDRTP